MQDELVDQAIELLEKANAGLQPELLSADRTRKLFKAYVRAQRLTGFGVAALSGKMNETQISRATGTSISKAKDSVVTGRVLTSSYELNDALKHGDISVDQAHEIAKAEESAPGVAKDLLEVAKAESFHVLRDKARKAKLDAEQHKDLARRQHEARSARTYSDALGMINIHLALEPHVGTPIVARAEAEAQRLAKKAKEAAENDNQTLEPFERHLANAYAALLGKNGKGRVKRPELVVLVSHEVAKSGWTEVKDGEVCKIPGVGPVAPEVAKKIARDAFLNGVFYDGKDLRQFKRWSRHIPVEVLIALELGEPSDFDGVACVDCGNRFRTEIDHVTPRNAQGPTAHPNLKPRCWSCHQIKTSREREAVRENLRSPDAAFGTSSVIPGCTADEAA